MIKANDIKKKYFGISRCMLVRSGEIPLSQAHDKEYDETVIRDAVKRFVGKFGGNMHKAKARFLSSPKTRTHNGTKIIARNIPKEFFGITRYMLRSEGLLDGAPRQFSYSVDMIAFAVERFVKRYGGDELLARERWLKGREKKYQHEYYIKNIDAIKAQRKALRKARKNEDK